MESAISTMSIPKPNAFLIFPLSLLPFASGRGCTLGNPSPKHKSVGISNRPMARPQDPRATEVNPAEPPPCQEIGALYIHVVFQTRFEPITLHRYPMWGILVDPFALANQHVAQ